MEEDLKYYDPKNIEFNALIKLTNFKNKKVLDAGCGIARLTLPISRYARNVVGIDIDKNIIRYCRLKKKRRNIKYFLSSIKNFEENGFDITILAQPAYNNFKENLYAINKILKKRGKLIIIRWVDKGNDYNSILTPFWNKDKKLIREVQNFSRIFTKTIKKFFKIKKIKIIRTIASYPDREKLSKMIIQDCPKSFTKKDEIILNKLLKRYNHRKINISMKMYLCEKK